ncbi:glycosyltransferase [uncultured Amnibacterium sp.]|uniref:glycosyltransferase n=1 Tax=uncultured Amnibacterium sp. TaxID=1631851 RepID=UPI0035C9CB7C
MIERSTVTKGDDAATDIFRRLSVIVSNYNYEQYVAQAIESALAVDWDDVEVIVVDDGSTDGSRAVIERYRDRVTVLHQENSTQRVAANRGFAASTGDVVIFLDSDDMLTPAIAREIAAAWRPGASKYQVQMARIDAEGRIIGSVFPDYAVPPSPELIRRWATVSASYPTPPGSGNAYARSFLDRIFPLDGSTGPAADSYCLEAAPLLGDVITLPRPLVLYRVHGDNVSNLLRNDALFTGRVERARLRHAYGLRLLGRVEDPERSALFRSRSLLQLRIASARLRPGDSRLPGDSRFRMLRNALLVPFGVGHEPMRQRILIMAWCVVVLIVPVPLARRVIHRRYDQTTFNRRRKWTQALVDRSTH